MDEKAFEERILALEPKLYHTACAILWNDADAADAMQECILKAWRKQDSLKDPERFSAWTMRILINECRNVQRRSRNRTVSLEDAMVKQEPIGEETMDLGLRQALRALPPKLRLPLLLHHMDGYSLEEIAGMLRLPVSTVKGRLYEARKRLRALLEKEAL
ncbi:MAG: sigma-70 family RNA polymerase sigma factor [Eubacteriales bacterium]|nr:sigma-70 family RNA polymerase sigma factor [Eubacteriales bacterium]